MQELISQLLGSDLAVRQKAIQAAEHCSDPTVIATLVQLMRDAATGEQPRREIAEVLGRTNHPDAIDALQAGAADPDEIYRGLCASGLGHVPTGQSVLTLIRLLTDGVNTVRNLAERGLLQMPQTVLEVGVEPLLMLLDNPVPLTRSPAARLLGLTQDARALGPLLDLLKRDRQWLVRMWAVKGLGDLGFGEAFEMLKHSLLHDEKNRVRGAAAEGLGKLQLPSCEPALTAALSDEDGGVRQHVEESLAKLRRQRLGHDQPEEHHEPHFDE